MLQNRLAFTSFFCLLVTLLGFSSCSLKKEGRKKKDSSFLANVSTKYNVLFNSKELLQQAQKNTNENITDHYLQLLSVFKEPNAASIQQNLGLMDSVIEKTNHIINEKQASKYVNEAFFLKGQAYYQQGDYFNANEFFDYVAIHEENQPNLKQEALLWQVRTLLQLGNLNAASEHLAVASIKLIEKNELKALSSATQAKNSLLLNNKASAIAQLSQAIEYSPHRRDRLRWQFLIGQLLFEREEYDLAYDYFSKVAKSNESYEMIFHTNLYRVEILNKTNPTVENRVSLFNKLLRDGKNKHYKGQIYQRIGDAYLLDKQLEPAITNYELAIQHTINNPYQQSVNYQKLANLYFDEAKYAQSSAYFDSTLLVLDKGNPTYALLSRKQTHLATLVQLLSNIAYQDTLIQLANLSLQDREIFIEKAIADNRPIEVPLNKKKGKTQHNNFILDNNVFPTNDRGNSGFYFASEPAISQGFSTFKKRWGNRGAGNYWRYANQTLLTIVASTEVDQADMEPPNQSNPSIDLRERYLNDLPDTPEKLALAQHTIKEALLSLGSSYQYEIMDNASAIHTYTNYLTRFNGDENTALVCFHLYRLYKETSPELAKTYQLRLAQEFPDSRYNLVLNDPLYFQKQQDRLQQFNKDYTQAYALFTSQDYANLILSAEKIQKDKTYQLLEDNLAQLAYLRAIAIGRTSPITNFKAALNDILANYPEEKIVVPLVKQHLTFIDSNEVYFQNRAIALDEKASDRSAFEHAFSLTPWPELSYSKIYVIPQYRKEYEVNDGMTDLKINQNTQNKSTLSIKNIEIGKISSVRHENSYRDITLLPDTANYYFVINVMNGSVNLSPSRYGLGQFNRGNYPTAALQHQVKSIGQDNQLIYIGNFSTYSEAKAYEQKISALLNNIMKIPEDLYYGFIVSDSIFSTFGNFDQIEEYNSLYQTQK